jgi:hypothetical protein
MNRIESGPSTERVVRNLLIFLLVAVFAAAYLLDGFYGYAYNNVNQLVKSLGQTDRPLPTPDARLSKEKAIWMSTDIALGTQRPDVDARLGPADIQHHADSYYLAPAGHLLARFENDRLAALQWVDGIHSATDIALQRWIGFVLAAFAGGLLVNFIRVARSRVSVSDDGLQVGKGAPAPLSAVRKIYIDPESVKGRVVIECELDGQKGAFMLDAYQVKHLDAVVEALQRATGITATYPEPAVESQSDAPPE